jgi:hypothetical protein
VNVTVFLGVTLCSLLGRHWPFERSVCVHLYGFIFCLDDKNLNGCFIPNFNIYVTNYKALSSRKERDMKDDEFVL